MVIDAPIQPGHTWASGDDVTAATLNKSLELAVARVPTPIDVVNGGTGGATVATAQAALAVKGRLEGWVEFGDNNTGVTLGTLPADSYVDTVHVQSTVVFNAGGADGLTVGWDSDVDALVTNLDLAAAIGIQAVSYGVSRGYNATQRTVKAYYIGAGGAPTTGKVLVIVEYWQVTTTP